MLVAVTGGTGFVGSHAVVALLRRGHDVRMVVRSPDKVDPTLAPHGHSSTDVEVVVGDMTDDASVRTALTGCDSVVHAASVFSFDPADAEEMARTNAEGMRAVFDHGIALGLDPIVHVSSVVALLRQDVRVSPVGPDAPPGTSPHPYSGSKAQQEREARRYQDDGHPVVIVHPGGVWGPHDPYDGETVQLVRTIARGGMTLCPTGALAISDVRDVADVLAAVVEPGRGPRRYSAAGHALPYRDIVVAVAGELDISRPTLPVPDAAVLATGRLASWLAGRTGRRPPVALEQAWMSTRVMKPDLSRTRDDLGVVMRPAREAIAAQVAWQRDADRL